MCYLGQALILNWTIAPLLSHRITNTQSSIFIAKVLHFFWFFSHLLVMYCVIAAPHISCPGLKIDCATLDLWVNFCMEIWLKYKLDLKTSFCDKCCEFISYGHITELFLLILCNQLYVIIILGSSPYSDIAQFLW